MSEEGKNLIKKLLVVDPSKRITPTQALKDPWFIKFKNIQIGSEEDKLDPNLMMKLREFKGVSTLKKVALNILVKMSADTREVELLRDMFTQIDIDQTGYITALELKEAL